LSTKKAVTKGARIGLLAAAVAGLTIGALGWFQVKRERKIDEEDLDRRAQVLAHQMSYSARLALADPSDSALREITERMNGFRRVIGYALYDAQGRFVAAGPGALEYTAAIAPTVQSALAGDPDVIDTIRTSDALIHVLAFRLPGDGAAAAGVLAVLHDMTFIEHRATARLVQFGFWILVITLLLIGLVSMATWAAYERPLNKLAEWMQRVRVEGAGEAPPVGLPIDLLASESTRLAASFRAARASSTRRSREEVREHNAWTRDRLRAHAIDCLQDRVLVIVSNREPYMHQFVDGRPRMIVPAGGLVTALDPVLQACGGLWVAHGGGDADRQTADAHGRLIVPPSDGRYTLRRVWLSREEEQGYYYGLSNEGLWPLCHLAHERPIFRASDWTHYVRANQRFADCVLEEIGTGPAAVLVQDYQLALVPAMLKAARPDIQVGLFWHIPWPNPEAFRICPWRAEILQGMLGADVVGFHLQQYCNNFLDTVDRMVEARLDWDHFEVETKGRRSLIRPFPISIESWAERPVPTGEALEQQVAHLREQHKLGQTRVVIGVERVDYTKGLPERLRAIERFLEKRPEFREKVTFVLLGAPSRTHLRRYRELTAELEALSDEINWKHQTETWKPLRLLLAHHDASAVHAFLHMADVCVVSSLHDGMNLVAKEYVAARPPGKGVLVLSEFAGAARELSDSLLINPYDTEQFADAIHYALSMPETEAADRMRTMQAQVDDHNVYRWAAGLITTLAATGSRSPRAASTPEAALLDASRVSAAPAVVGRSG